MALGDGLGAARGFANTILPRAGSGNLGQLAALIQKKKEAEADMAFKQKESALKTGEEMRKGLLTANLSPILQEAQQSILKNAYDGLNTVSRRINMGDSSGASEAYSQIKLDSDNAIRGLQSAQEEVKNLEDLVKADKDNAINAELVGGAINDILKKSLVTENGRLVGVNNNEAANIKTLLDNPDLWNNDVMVDKHIKNLGQIQQERATDAAGSTMKQTSTPGLFVIKKDGSVARDPKTNKPIINPTPETVDVWDQIPIQKKKLDKIVVETGKSRLDAYKDLIGNKAVYKEELTTKQASTDGSGAAEKEANANQRYETIRKIVDKFDEAALAQTFSLGDNTKVEFAGGGSRGNLPGETKPDRIVLYKRSVLPADPSNPLQVRYSDWFPAEIMPINTEDAKNTAIFKLNSVYNESSNKSSNVVGQDQLNKVHLKYQSSKPKQVDLGF